MKQTLFSKFICPILLVGFLIGTYNGRIGVWKDQDPQPYRVIPCPVCILSARQQALLSDGIHLDTMEDVDQLIRTFFP